MDTKRLYRSRKNMMIAGICGGLGEYFNVDPTILRLVWVIFGCTGAGIVAYVLAAIIIPSDPEY
ncbi:PspC domain-containing protein [Cuneatibacter sp. NSJ-177]|uniref:PspC domain-containing protein n=1 Tax=Cuneatibacter sp. NSJ-177 TaxID=2931401 RepID=UPI001FD093CC|nr:PspC domain-containing protein [Cuneatibacter sp. NSJ-177]MCJ7834172.1 PspC domain-containing protein [Cuneatibacter sp. NSJ-177]